MFSLWAAPGTTVTSLIDRAKQSANSHSKLTILVCCSSVRSSPMVSSESIASTRSVLNGSEWRVKTPLSRSLVSNFCLAPTLSFVEAVSIFHTLSSCSGSRSVLLLVAVVSGAEDGEGFEMTPFDDILASLLHLAIVHSPRDFFGYFLFAT